MPSRRSTSHVRPRPPSRGRLTAQPVKVAAPDRRRVRQYQGMDARRPRAPLAARTLLGLSIAGLAIVAFVFASGGIGPALTSPAGSFGAAFGRLPATPVPSVKAFVAARATETPAACATSSIREGRGRDPGGSLVVRMVRECKRLQRVGPRSGRPARRSGRPSRHRAILGYVRSPWRS